MKQLIIILISALSIICFSIEAEGANPPAKTVPVKKEKKDPDPKGLRVPGRIIYCSLSIENGVELPGVTNFHCSRVSR